MNLLLLWAVVVWVAVLVASSTRAQSCFITNKNVTFTLLPGDDGTNLAHNAIWHNSSCGGHRLIIYFTPDVDGTWRFTARGGAFDFPAALLSPLDYKIAVESTGRYTSGIDLQAETCVSGCASPNTQVFNDLVSSSTTPYRLDADDRANTVILNAQAFNLYVFSFFVFNNGNDTHYQSVSLGVFGDMTSSVTTNNCVHYKIENNIATYGLAGPFRILLPGGATKPIFAGVLFQNASESRKFFGDDVRHISFILRRKDLGILSPAEPLLDTVLVLEDVPDVEDPGGCAFRYPQITNPDPSRYLWTNQILPHLFSARLKVNQRHVVIILVDPTRPDTQDLELLIAADMYPPIASSIDLTMNLRQGNTFTGVLRERNDYIGCGFGKYKLYLRLSMPTKYIRTVSNETFTSLSSSARYSVRIKDLNAVSNATFLLKRLQKSKFRPLSDLDLTNLEGCLVVGNGTFEEYLEEKEVFYILESDTPLTVQINVGDETCASDLGSLCLTPSTYSAFYVTIVVTGVVGFILSANPLLNLGWSEVGIMFGLGLMTTLAIIVAGIVDQYHFLFLSSGFGDSAAEAQAISFVVIVGIFCFFAAFDLGVLARAMFNYVPVYDCRERRTVRMYTSTFALLFWPCMRRRAAFVLLDRPLIISWKWDIRSVREVQESKTLIKCFERCIELGYRYVMVDVISLDQRSVDAGKVMYFVAAYSRFPVLVAIDTDDSIKDYQSRFWTNVEMLRYRQNRRVFALTNDEGSNVSSLLSHSSSRSLDEILTSSDCQATFEVDRVRVFLLGLPFAIIIAFFPMRRIQRITAEGLDLELEEIYDLIQLARPLRVLLEGNFFQRYVRDTGFVASGFAFLLLWTPMMILPPFGAIYRSLRGLGDGVLYMRWAMSAVFILTIGLGGLFIGLLSKSNDVGGIIMYIVLTLFSCLMARIAVAFVMMIVVSHRIRISHRTGPRALPLGTDVIQVADNPSLMA